MINPVLKWALQVLQQSEETPANEPVSQSLKLVGIDQIQVNSQPLESVFSVIAQNDESSPIVQKKIGWQALDVQQIVYPTENVNEVTLDIPEPPGSWDRFHANENLALALIEKYGAFLSISPDALHLSFYDAVKSASAIHDCLERGQTDKPFLLVSGDFSGIQETIYTISSRGALKTMRARSFMLELLTEHIIYEIQQATASARHSLIFLGGGGFSLLVPNTAENQNATDVFARIINEWTLEQFGFQLFLALDCIPLSADDLEGSLFKDIWELMADKLGKQKQRKFWKSNNFGDLFRPEMPKQLANQDACQITHRDDLPEDEIADEDLEGIGRVSKLAYRLWRLGDRLTEFNCIVRFPASADNYEDGTLRFPMHQSQSNSYQYAVYKACKANLPSQFKGYERWLVNSWELDNYDEKTFSFLYGYYVRSVADLPPKAQTHEKEEYRRDHKDKEIKEPESTTASFDGLAKAACGSELIGCMRMDVDNSGEFFSGVSGLGVAAISNLSRSMNLFFKGYLNQICGMTLGNLVHKDYPISVINKLETKGRHVSIVYAGGDDLFIAGAWDDVAELAFDINACFREFSCWHPDVHLSGGITLHKPKFPLYQMAHIAKQAEEAAKKNKNSETNEMKNSFSLFYNDALKRRNTSLNERIRGENQNHGWSQKSDRIAVASQWDEYDDVVQLTKQLQKVYQHPNLSHAFYRKLFETLKIWQEQGQLYMPMMFHALRQLDRIEPQTPELAELKNLLFREDCIKKLHIPLNWVEYLNRQSEGGN